MKLRETNKHFVTNIMKWLSDKESLKAEGFNPAEATPGKVLIEVEKFYDLGKVYAVINNDEIIGFAIVEFLGESAGIHIFLDQNHRNSILGYQLFKTTIRFCFNDLKFKKVYTLAKGEVKEKLERTKIMKPENRSNRLGYELYSVEKGDFN